jgi:chromosome segregation ATPase
MRDEEDNFKFNLGVVMSDLQKQIDDLNAHNAELKKELENVKQANAQMQQGIQYMQTEKAVAHQTIGEIMNGNLQNRTQLSLLQGAGEKMAAELMQKQKQIDELTAQLAVANKVVEKATNLSAPKDSKAA